MDFNQIQQATKGRSQSAEYNEGLRAHMLKVYNYMAAALALTGVIAFVVSTQTWLMQAIFGTPLAYVVIFAPLPIVWYLSARIFKMSEGAAQTWFWVYAGTVGLSLSLIFAIYELGSIARVFFIVSGAFASLSLFGYTTKKDLSGWGSFLLMGIFGLILAFVINIFLGSSALQFAIGVIGVLIFAGLTAYETQNIKHTYFYLSGVPEGLSKAAILGALGLYIAFIGMFRFLMAFMGEER